jgi:hypothetical protein
MIRCIKEKQGREGGRREERARREEGGGRKQGGESAGGWRNTGQAICIDVKDNEGGQQRDLQRKFGQG